MFFELSYRKILTLAVVVAVIVIGAVLFVSLNTQTSFLEKGNEWFGRLADNFSYSLLYGSGSGDAPTPAGRAEGIPVLLYHGTPPEGNANPPLPQNVFVEQMRALKADGWHTITLEQFGDFIHKGKPLPAKSFLLTFDDGRKESFYPVDPVLKDLGYNAVMFTITGFSLPDDATKPASSFYLSKTELQYMVDSGRWELESHGGEDHRLYDVPSPTPIHGSLQTIRQQHFLSNRFWLPAQTRVETPDEYAARVTHDLESSKETLQKDFGINVTAFAYPFNDYGQDTANYPNAVSALSNIVSGIYSLAFYQVDASKDDPYNYPDSTAYQMKRIEPIASWSGAELVSLLDGSAPKKLPYNSGNFASGWSGNWGSVEAKNGVLQLRATSRTTGSVALIDGSEKWQDYALHASLDWKAGEAASLVARYESDSKTFLTCAFTTDRIIVESHDNGKQITLASAPASFAHGTLSLGMEVSGADVTCSANGASLTAEAGKAFLHSGQAGVEIWDPAANVGAIDVKKVSVSAL